MPKHQIEISEVMLIGEFQKKGILTNQGCYFCNSKLELVGRKRDKNSRVQASFRCTNTGCQKFQSVYRNSFFSLFKTPMLLVVEIIKLWCSQITISKGLDLL